MYEIHVHMFVHVQYVVGGFHISVLPSIFKG